MEIIFYIKINNCTPNFLYNNSIAMKLLKGKVGEFWWETRLWLKLIVGHCTSLVVPTRQGKSMESY